MKGCKKTLRLTDYWNKFLQSIVVSLSVRKQWKFKSRVIYGTERELELPIYLRTIPIIQPRESH